MIMTRFIRRAIRFCALVLSMAAFPLFAAETTWTGASGADWNTDSNWSAGVPGVNDTAIFTTAVTVTPPDSFAGMFYVNGGVTVTAEIAGTCAFTLRTSGDSSGFTKTGSGTLTLTPYRRLTRGTVTAAAGTLVFSGPGTEGDPGAFDKVVIKAGAVASVANSAVANRHGVIVRYGQYEAADEKFCANNLNTPALFDAAWDSAFGTVASTRGGELRLVTAANPLLTGTDVIPSACAGKSDYTVAFRGMILFDWRNFSWPSLYFTRYRGSRGGLYMLSYSNGYRMWFDADITSSRNLAINNYGSGDYGWGSIDMAMQFTEANPGGLKFTRVTHIALRENGVIDDALIWYGACCNDLKTETGATFNVPAGQAFAVGDASGLSLQANTLSGAAGSLFAIMGGNANGSSKYLNDAVFTGLSGTLELGRPAGLKLTASAAAADYSITGYGEVWLTAAGAEARVSNGYAGIVNVPAGQTLAVPAAWGTDMEFHGLGTLTLADEKHKAAAAQFQGTVALPSGTTVVASTMEPSVGTVALGAGSTLKIGSALQLANNNPEVETAAPYTDSTAWTFLGKMNATQRSYKVGSETIVDTFKSEPATAYVNGQGELQLTDDGGQARAAYLNRVISRDDVMDAAFTYTLDHTNLPEGGEEGYQAWGEGGSIVLQCNGLTTDTGMNATYGTANPLKSYGISMHAYNEKGLRWINDGMNDDLVSENDGVVISVRKAIDYRLHYEAGVLRVEARQDGKVWKSSRDVSALFDRGTPVYFGFTGRGAVQNERNLYWVNTRVSNLTITFRKAPLAFEPAGGDYAFTADNYQIGNNASWNQDGSLTLLPAAVNKSGKAVLKTALSSSLPFSVDWTMVYDEKGSGTPAQGSSFTLQATGPTVSIKDAARGNGGVPAGVSYGLLVKVYDNKNYWVAGEAGNCTNCTDAGFSHYSAANTSQDIHLDYDGAGGFSWRITSADGTKISEKSCMMPGVLELGDVYPSFFGNQALNSDMYLGTSLKDVTISMPPTNGYATAFAGSVSVAAGTTAELEAGSYSTLDTAEAMSVSSLGLAAGSTLNVSPEKSNTKVAFETINLVGDAEVAAQDGAIVRLVTLDLTDLAQAKTLTARGKTEYADTFTVAIPDCLKKLKTPVKIVDLTNATLVGSLPAELVVTDAAGTVLAPRVAKLEIRADGVYLGRDVPGLAIIIR